MSKIKNIREITEPLKEQIVKGDVHTINEMKAWLKPLGYSDTINEAAINFILREFVMNKVPSGSFCNAEMIVELFRPQLEHQTSYFSHQPSIVHTIEEMKAWLKPLGNSNIDRINAIRKEVLYKEMER